MKEERWRGDENFHHLFFFWLQCISIFQQHTPQDIQDVSHTVKLQDTNKKEVTKENDKNLNVS